MLISGAGLVVLLMSVMTPAQAQLVAPLTTSDGKIACLQGITGVGRAAQWEAVKDPVALGGWALSETGGDATAYLRFGDGLIASRVDPEQIGRFRQGDTVEIAFPQNKVHVFDAGSGRRL